MKVRLFLKQFSTLQEPNGNFTRLDVLALDVKLALNQLIEYNKIGQYETFILDLYIRNFELSSIASILNTTEQKIDEIITEVCDEIYKILGENYFEYL